LLHCFSGRGGTCTFASPKGCYDRWPILLESICQCMWNPSYYRWVICSIGYMWNNCSNFFVLEWLKWFLYYYYCITVCKYKELVAKLAIEHITRGFKKVVCFASMFFFKSISLVFWFQYCYSNNNKKDNVKFQHYFLRGELTTSCALVSCVVKQLQYVFN
jgi:hypothetical protein